MLFREDDMTKTGKSAIRLAGDQYGTSAISPFIRLLSAAPGNGLKLHVAARTLLNDVFIFASNFLNQPCSDGQQGPRSSLRIFNSLAPRDCPVPVSCPCLPIGHQLQRKSSAS